MSNLVPERVSNPLILLGYGGRGGIWSVVDFAYYFSIQCQTLPRIVSLFCLVFSDGCQTFVKGFRDQYAREGFESRAIRQTRGMAPR